WTMWERRVAVIEHAVAGVKGVTTKVVVPDVANHTPNLQISWDPALVKLTVREMITNLRNGTPSIEVVGDRSVLSLTVFMLQPGEERLVASRIREELTKAAA